MTLLSIDTLLRGTQREVTEVPVIVYPVFHWVHISEGPRDLGIWDFHLLNVRWTIAL